MGYASESNVFREPIKKTFSRWDLIKRDDNR